MRRLLVLPLILALSGSVSAEVLSSEFAAKLAANPKAEHTAIVRLNGAEVPVGANETRKSGRIRLNHALRARFAASSQSVLATIGEWQKQAKAARAAGGTAVRDVSQTTELWLSNALVVRGTGQALTDLSHMGEVAAVLPDRERKLLPTYPGRSAAKQDAYTYGLKKVGADRVHNELLSYGEGVLVGELDTGVDANHPDLKGKIVAFKSFVGAGDTANDGHGHGTHCAGTILGGNTSGTAIGVAPKAKMVAGQIFNAQGSTTDAAILGAMSWIADPDGNPDTDDAPCLVSNSWGGSPGSMESEKPYWDAVANWVRLGIFPSFAAGNEGPGASSMGTPGGFPHSFAVGATDSNDKIAYFSSRGPITWAGTTYTKPDVSAPGVDVYSAKPGGGYQSMSGTSMACPHTSGVAALLYSKNPDASIAEVANFLKETSLDLGDAGHDNVFGVGRINAHAAVSVAMNGGKVTVKLTNEAGQALAGRVKITGGATATIADSGATTLVLIAGSYTLVASSFGYLDSAPMTLEVAAGQATEAAFVLKKAPSGKLTVTIKDAGTQGALAGKVAVVDAPVTEAVSDPATGNATLELPYGTYTLKVRAFAHDTKTIENVKVDGDTTIEAALSHLPDILLYDHDLGKPYETFYQAGLTALAKPFTYFDASKEAGEDTILAYPIIVYFTGDDYNGTVPDEMQAMLRKYLASGGRLIITGQDIGYDLKGTPFYSEVMHAKFVKDTASSKQISGGGLSFSITGGDGAGNQKYPDQIENLGGTALFEYDGGDGPAAIHSTVGDGQVAYLAFGIEGIDTAANRQKVLDLLLKKLNPTFAQRAARLPAIARIAGADAAEQYRAYLVEAYEALTPAEQAANAHVLRGLQPR